MELGARLTGGSLIAANEKGVPRIKGEKPFMGETRARLCKPIKNGAAATEAIESKKDPNMTTPAAGFIAEKSPFMTT